MTKTEVINQLQSLRESTAAYARGSDEEIFRKDVEALDAAIAYLRSAASTKRAHWISKAECGYPNRLAECSRCGYEMPYPGETHCPDCAAFCPTCRKWCFSKGAKT